MLTAVLTVEKDLGMAVQWPTSRAATCGTPEQQMGYTTGKGEAGLRSSSTLRDLSNISTRCLFARALTHQGHDENALHVHFTVGGWASEPERTEKLMIDGIKSKGGLL